MIQKYVLVFILIIIVIVLFFKSLNVEHFYTQSGDDDNTCTESTSMVNYWNDDEVKRKIHIVNPRDPCCIKSCINDFTNVDCKKHSGEVANPQTCHETTGKDGNGKEGELRPEFVNKNNIHYFLTSGCYSCVKNFKGGVELLANPDDDPNCKKTTQA